MNLSPIYIVALFGTIVACFFQKKKYLANIMCIFLLFLGIMRGVEVGTDCLGYQADYTIIKNITDGSYIRHKFEFGFVALIALFKNYITPLYLPFVSFLFMVFFAGVIRFIRYRKASLGMALFVLLVFSHYFYAYNIMRQMFALGIILFLFPLLYEKKYRKFVLSVVLVSILFHKSSMLAVLLVPLHYVCLNKEEFFSKKKMYLMIVISFVFYFIADITIKQYFATFAGFFYSRYEGYMLGMMGRQGTGFLFSGMQSLFTLVLIFWYKKNKEYDFEFVAYVVGVSIFNFLSAFSIVATRVAEVFLIFNIVLFPLMMSDKTNRRLRFIRWAIFITGIVLFIHNYGINNNGMVNPYYIESRFVE